MAISEENLLLVAALAVGVYPSTFTRDRVATLRTLRLGEGRNYSENASLIDDALQAMVEKEHLELDKAENSPKDDRFTATKKLMGIFSNRTNLDALVGPIVEQYKFTATNLSTY